MILFSVCILIHHLAVPWIFFTSSSVPPYFSPKAFLSCSFSISTFFLRTLPTLLTPGFNIAWQHVAKTKYVINEEMESLGTSLNLGLVQRYILANGEKGAYEDTSRTYPTSPNKKFPLHSSRCLMPRNVLDTDNETRPLCKTHVSRA